MSSIVNENYVLYGYMGETLLKMNGYPWLKNWERAFFTFVELFKK
jgi:hypothetical protein